MSGVNERSDFAGDHKICFRHSCRTKYVGSLNKHLSEEQKTLILGTPFAWVVELKDCVKISRSLLSPLISRWVERRGGFDMGTKVVGFSLLDVCVSLGLRVVGEKIDLNQEGSDSESRKLFGGEKVVDIEMVYDFVLKHMKDLSVDVFCKLYLLVAISEFLLPNRTGRVYPILFTVVDDLSSMGKYSWGCVVYEYLVRSISDAKMLMRDKASTKHFHVDGCVYLIQPWAFNYFVIPKSKDRFRSTKFPRILHWMEVKVDDRLIKSSLKNNMVVSDVAASVEELTYVVVREGFQVYGRGSNGGREVDLNKAVEQQEHMLGELQKELSELKALMSEKKNEQHNHAVEENLGEMGDLNGSDRDEEKCGDIGKQDFVESAEKSSGYSVEENIGEMVGKLGTPNFTHPKDSTELFGSRKVCGSRGNGVFADSTPDLVGEQNVPKQDDDVSVQSNMYLRRLDHPRKRFKSHAIKTPFATYTRRKRHK